jgi:DNA-binding CsgD family transcriptional regulator
MERVPINWTVVWGLTSVSALPRQVLEQAEPTGMGDELLVALAIQAGHLAAADAARRRADQLVRQVTDTGRQRSGVDTVVEPVEAHALPADIIDRSRSSVAVVLPWRQPPGEDTLELLAAAAAAAERGRAVRVLLDRWGPSERGIADLVTRGAAVRLARGPVCPLLVVDGQIAVLPETLPETLPGPGEAVTKVSQPSVVTLVRTAFDQAWRWAGTVAVPGGVGPDEVKQRILDLLATGAKDELIARRLGISLRTCRRHVAEILLRAGAVSRFQAGVFAVRDGVVALQPDYPDE